MKLEPLTRLEDAPLVCDLKWTARILNRSVRSIEEDLALGVMVPEPMPVISRTVKGQPRKNQKRQWSRYALEAHLAGGYLQFVRLASAKPKSARTPGAARRYFGRVAEVEDRKWSHKNSDGSPEYLER